MANRTINDLSPLSAAAATDYVPIWRTAAGLTQKITVDALLGRDTAQTFTRGLTIEPSVTTDLGLVINMPAGITTARPFRVLLNNVLTMQYNNVSGNNQLSILDFDNSNSAGSVLYLGRNNNGSTPAPGALLCVASDGATDYLYPDDSDIWRYRTAAVTNATQSGGTVIGSQSSNIAFKDITGEPISDEEALAKIVEAAELIKRFVYKSGAYGGEEFSGIVLSGDAKPRYGMDADPEHPAGKALNEINAIGDIFKAIRNLSQRLEALEA